MSFSSFVTHAPKVLFRLGWVLAVLTFCAMLVPALLQGNGNVILGAFVAAILAALQMVLAPWIAAALLWRVDKFLESKE